MGPSSTSSFITIALAQHTGEWAPLNVQYLSPHMSFILKGSQIKALELKSWFKSKTSIQDYRNEIQNSY